MSAAPTHGRSSTFEIDNSEIRRGNRRSRKPLARHANVPLDTLADLESQIHFPTRLALTSKDWRAAHALAIRTMDLKQVTDVIAAVWAVLCDQADSLLLAFAPKMLAALLGCQ